jgi:hypothetical protein
MAGQESNQRLAYFIGVVMWGVQIVETLHSVAQLLDPIARTHSAGTPAVARRYLNQAQATFSSRGSCFGLRRA